MTLNSTVLARELAAYQAAQSVAPKAFDWASANCCHWASGWVLRVRGRDPMAGLPRTEDAAAALRLVRRLGGNLVGAWSKQLGLAPVAATFAQLGDVVLVRLKNDEQPGFVGLQRAVGICAGRSVICIDTLGQPVHVPLYTGVCAWRLAEVAA